MASGFDAQVRGQVVVVTGAGRGIGRALAERFAAAGARLVLSDVDSGAVAAVAGDLGAQAVIADLSTAAGVAHVVAVAEGIGPVEVWVGNAGVPGPPGLAARDAAWTATLEVNVLAHVRAARALVPQWLERGRGRFVVTASAAGLLTMPGAAAYTVTKHAAVAFAEWLSLTYGDRGVAVHCLCPQGVSTQMLDDLGALADATRGDGTLSPTQVADALWEAMAQGSFLVLPHPEVARYYRNRAADTDRWLAGMRPWAAQYAQD